MGRPTLLTPETSEKIVNLIKLGNYRETACAAAGIDSRTMRNWLKRGAEGEEPYATFSGQMDDAEAGAEARHVAVLTSASREDWRAAAWILARKYPARWSEHQVHDVTTREAVPLDDIDSIRKAAEANDECLTLEAAKPSGESGRTS